MNYRSGVPLLPTLNYYTIVSTGLLVFIIGLLQSLYDFQTGCEEKPIMYVYFAILFVCELCIESKDTTMQPK